MCFSATGFTVCPFGTATVRALIHLLLLCIVCVFLCYWLHCLSIRNGTVRALIRLLLLCIVCVFLCHWLHCLCSLFSIRNSHNHSIDSSAAVVHCVCVTLPLAPLCLSIRNSHNHSVDSSAAVVHCVLLFFPPSSHRAVSCWKGLHGIFNVCSVLGVRCVHEGMTVEPAC